jgi:hypothetical protein
VGFLECWSNEKQKVISQNRHAGVLVAYRRFGESHKQQADPASAQASKFSSITFSDDGNTQ